jgi:hypothetical protein
MKSEPQPRQSSRLVIGIGRCLVDSIRRALRRSLAKKDRSRLGSAYYFVQGLSPYRHTVGFSNADLEPWREEQLYPTIDHQLLLHLDLENADCLLLGFMPDFPVYTAPNEGVVLAVATLTDMMARKAFEPLPAYDGSFPSRYLDDLVWFIRQCRADRPVLPLVIVKAEYTGRDPQGNHDIGNPDLRVAARWMKSWIERQGDSGIHFIDADDTIAELRRQSRCAVEHAFPHQYIRHDREMRPLGVVRDCTHATELVFNRIAQDIWKLLGDDWLGVPISSVEFCVDPIETSFVQRASDFLVQFEEYTPQELLALPATQFSAFLEYSAALPTPDRARAVQSLCRHLLENWKQPMIIDLHFQIQDLCAHMYKDVTVQHAEWALQLGRVVLASGFDGCGNQFEWDLALKWIRALLAVVGASQRKGQLRPQERSLYLALLEDLSTPTRMRSPVIRDLHERAQENLGNSL